VTTPSTTFQTTDKIIIALASGATIRAAARKAGVSQRTVYRRLQDPEARTQLADARKQFVERALSHLTRGTVEAAIVLRRLLRSKVEKNRLYAARAIIELGSKLHDKEELQERFAELEKQIAERRGNP
jgi:AcrR family transcriptional regulator